MLANCHTSLASNSRQEGDEDEDDGESKPDDIARDRTPRFYCNDKDPPGQKSIYIPPGDHSQESYRLATFKKFPLSCFVSVREFAAVGFYYTGFRDRVKCFSCGMAVEGWMKNDDPKDKKWHKETCNMVCGAEDSNVPFDTSSRQQEFRMLRQSAENLSIASTSFSQLVRAGFQSSLNQVANSMSSLAVACDDSSMSEPKLRLANILSLDHERFLQSLNLSMESDRRKTFTKWPSYPAPLLVIVLAENGFFFLGNLDRTQCSFCSGVLRNWGPDDDVMEQHRKHFPNCRMVKGLERRNKPMGRREREIADEALRNSIDCVRSEQPLQEPPDPGPAEQLHLAQYFPCQDAQSPHMRHEEQRLETFDSRWPSHRIKATPAQIAEAGFFFLGQGDRTKCYYCNGGLQNWDVNDEPWTEHGKWFPGCEFVLRRKGAEFVQRLVQGHPNLNRPRIRNPVSYDIPPTPTPNHTNMSMSNSNLPGGPSSIPQVNNSNQERCQKRTRNETESVQATNPKKKKNIEEDHSSGSSEKDASALIQSLQDSDICKTCHHSKSNVVAIPCGHLSFCLNCSETSRRRCNICHGSVAEFLRVFRT